MDNSTEVLVLEPDPAARILLVAIVKHRKLRPVACGSTREAAFHCLERERYATVILDADMPRADALLRGLTDPPGAGRPKIILATPPNTPKPDYADVDFIVTKPFQVEEIDAALAACCPRNATTIHA